MPALITYFERNSLHMQCTHCITVSLCRGMILASCLSQDPVIGSLVSHHCGLSRFAHLHLLGHCEGQFWLGYLIDTRVTNRTSATSFCLPPTFWVLGTSKLSEVLTACRPRFYIHTSVLPPAVSVYACSSHWRRRVRTSHTKLNVDVIRSLASCNILVVRLNKTHGFQDATVTLLNSLDKFLAFFFFSSFLI